MLWLVKDDTLEVFKVNESLMALLEHYDMRYDGNVVFSFTNGVRSVDSCFVPSRKRYEILIPIDNTWMIERQVIRGELTEEWLFQLLTVHDLYDFDSIPAVSKGSAWWSAEQIREGGCDF